MNGNPRSEMIALMQEIELVCGSLMSTWLQFVAYLQHFADNLQVFNRDDVVLYDGKKAFHEYLLREYPPEQGGTLALWLCRIAHGERAGTTYAFVDWETRGPRGVETGVVRFTFERFGEKFLIIEERAV